MVLARSIVGVARRAVASACTHRQGPGAAICSQAGTVAAHYARRGFAEMASALEEAAGAAEAAPDAAPKARGRGRRVVAPAAAEQEDAVAAPPGASVEGEAAVLEEAAAFEEEAALEGEAVGGEGISSEEQVRNAASASVLEALQATLRDETFATTAEREAAVLAIFQEIKAARAFTLGTKALEAVRSSGALALTGDMYACVLMAGRRLLRPREIRHIYGTFAGNANDERALAAVAANGGLPRGGALLATEEGSPFGLAPVTTSYLASSRQSAYGLGEAAIRIEAIIKEDMAREGIAVPMAVYEDIAGSLMTVSANAAAGGILIGIARALEKAGVQPSVLFYNRMLHVLPRCGYAERANNLFERMVANGLESLQSYVIRIGTAVHTRDYAMALSTYKTLVKHHGMHQVACNSLIHGFLESGNLSDALALLEEMKANPACQPNNITGSTFITYFYHSGDLSAARDVITYFASRGYPQTTADYANMTRLFARYDGERAAQTLATLVEIGRAQQSKAPASATPPPTPTPKHVGGAAVEGAVPEEPLTVDVYIYNAILGILLDRSVSYECKMALTDIIVSEGAPSEQHLRGAGAKAADPVKKLKPVPGSLASFAMSCSDNLRQVLCRMHADGVQPTSVTYDIVMRALRSRNDNRGILSVYSQLIKTRTPLFSNHMNIYLGALIELGDRRPIEAFIQTMADRRVVIHRAHSEQLAALGIAHARPERTLNAASNPFNS